MCGLESTAASAPAPEPPALCARDTESPLLPQPDPESDPDPLAAPPSAHLGESLREQLQVRAHAVALQLLRPKVERAVPVVDAHLGRGGGERGEPCSEGDDDRSLQLVAPPSRPCFSVDKLLLRNHRSPLLRSTLKLA